MKKTIVLSVLAFLLLGVLSWISISKTPAGYIGYLTTSYSTARSYIIADYRQNNRIISLDLGSVDARYDLSIGTVLAERYGSKLIVLDQAGQVQRELELDYYQIEDVLEFNKQIYVLFNYKSNKCKIVKYDSNFNILGESPDFTGVARNIRVHSDTIYLVSNDVLAEPSQTILSSISPLTLEQTNSQVVEPLTFAYHLDLSGEYLALYGNIQEDDFTLSVSLYDSSLGQVRTETYGVEAIWVKKILKTPTRQYVVNAASLIQLDHDFNLVGVFDQDEKVILDAEFTEAGLGVLSRDLRKGDMLIEVLDPETLEILVVQKLSLGLEQDYLIPALIWK